MKLGVSLMLVLIAAADVFSQSGRVKPTETPSPRPVIQPSIIYLPTQTTTKAPKPTPTPEDDGEVVRVASTLVPIPVSVIDSNGRAITSLTLNDFELKVDGKPAVISELFRSETPVRLAMLFDNSGSV